MCRLPVTNYFCVENFQVHDFTEDRRECKLCMLLLGGFIVFMLLKWVGVFGPEILEQRRYSGFRDYSTHFGGKVSIAEPPSTSSSKMKAPASLPLALCLGPYQAVHPTRHLAVGWHPFRKHPCQVPFPKRCGVCNQMVSEAEAIENLVLVPDLARVIPIPHRTSFCLCFHIF